MESDFKHVWNKIIEITGTRLLGEGSHKISLMKDESSSSESVDSFFTKAFLSYVDSVYYQFTSTSLMLKALLLNSNGVSNAKPFIYVICNLLKVQVTIIADSGEPE